VPTTTPIQASLLLPLVLSGLVLALLALVALLARSLSAARTRLALSERAATERDEARALLEAARRAQTESDRMAVRLEAERDAARAELERMRQGEDERSRMVRSEIENLANRIFDEKTGRFREMGTTAIAELVGPVRENLEKLQKALVDSEKADAVREESMKAALERVGSINDRLGTQAEGLARALKGDNKLVGDFGEVLLEQLLEFAGLRKGVHFVEQGSGMELKSGDGSVLRPDVVILLPENRCLVVDSKMSLASWSDAQTDDETARDVALEAFRRSVRAHVDDLSSKSYPAAMTDSGKTTVDFTFLFVPVEAAFQAVLRLDAGLYRHAFERRVVLVSPTTLLALLTTVTHTWKQWDLGRNASLISRRASLMLDKLSDFLASMERVGDQLQKAQDSYAEARRRLVDGNGNLLGQARKLQDLGVKSDKPFPRSLRDEGFEPPEPPE
jgi:DNA recombination protein RmuC